VPSNWIIVLQVGGVLLAGLRVALGCYPDLHHLLLCPSALLALVTLIPTRRAPFFTVCRACRAACLGV
jgi:hypothetical protein